MATAYHAHIKAQANKIIVVMFETESGVKDTAFKYRKSWSNKKYVDKGMEALGLVPDAFLNYSWDMTAL